MWLFCYSDFERNYDVLKSKSPCILLNKNINFVKNQTKLRMGSSTHNFRETNLVLSSYKNPKLKVQLWWVGARERKKKDFLYCLFCPKEFFLTFVLIYSISQCIVYWIHEYTFKINTLLHIKKHYFIQFCCLFIKSLKAFSVFLSSITH